VLEEGLERRHLAVVVDAVGDEADEAAWGGLAGATTKSQAQLGTTVDSLLISPTPAVHTHHHHVSHMQSLAPKVGRLTRPADEADQLRRAPAIVADGDDVVEMALPLFRDPSKHIHEAVGSGALGEERDSMSAAVRG
jgi:hypothetical protein